MKLGGEDRIIGFDVIPATRLRRPRWWSPAPPAARPWTASVPRASKSIALSEFPVKGGRPAECALTCFLNGEDHLTLGAAAMSPAMAAAGSGVARTLPVEMGRRDGSGVLLEQSIDAVASSPEASAKHFYAV